MEKEGSMKAMPFFTSVNLQFASAASAFVFPF